MLDALVAEARLRWGLDLAAGLQVIAAEHLAGTPLEPSRPALIVPAALLRIEPGPVAALPGRHGHGTDGDDPVAVLRRLYPDDHPVEMLTDGTRPTHQVSVFLEIEGAAHYLPAYAGNLDIMTSAGLQVAERIAAAKEAAR